MSDTVYIEHKLYVREHIRIKNMLCSCCTRVVRSLLEQAGILVENIEPGKAVILLPEEIDELASVDRMLSDSGMGLIRGREEIIVESVKQNVIDLIHRMNNVNSIVQKSDFLVEKMGMSYQVLSRIFARHYPVTLEKYIILNKIERIKELIDQGEFTLSEIAWMMDYNSVHYLSGQFKKYTGYSVTDYKSGKGSKVPLDQIGSSK